MDQCLLIVFTMDSMVVKAHIAMSTITQTNIAQKVGAIIAPLISSNLAVTTELITQTLYRRVILVHLQVLTHCHQSGNNTTLRIGDKPSDSSKAGVFNSTTVAEKTDANYGTATEYCGRVFYSHHPKYGEGYYYISTGLGTSDIIWGAATVPAACISAKYDTFTTSYCYDGDCPGHCPQGWGSLAELIANKPGCWSGSYYPNPTPTSNTDLHTGSLYGDKCIEPALIDENPCRHKNAKIHS